MSSELTYRLNFSVSGVMGDMAHLLVYNGYLEIVHSGYGGLTLNLPKGIYTVVISLSEIKEERLVALDRDIDEVFELPKIYSSIPARGFREFNESVTLAAEKYSREVTIVDHENIETGNSLFLFFTNITTTSFESFSQTEGRLGNNFIILNSKRQKLYSLNSNYEVKWGPDNSWLAFNARLADGIYYIHYKGGRNERAREIPVYVFKDWQTQIFLGIFDEPVFSSLRIKIVRNLEGFDSYSADYLLMEAVIRKAQNGIYYFPEHDLWELAVGKWNDPMKGLLAIHMFLAGKRVKDFNYQLVISNLSRLLGDDCPDVKALKIIIAQKFLFSKAYSWITISQPCMFLAGMQAAVKGLSHHQVIEPKSSAEDILEELYTDLLWTSYKPQKLRRRPSKKLQYENPEQELFDSSHDVLEDQVTVKFINPLERFSFDSSEEDSSFKYENPLAKGIQNRTPRLPQSRKPAILNSWVANLILEEAEKMPEKLTTENLASALRLTPSLINQSIDSLVSSKSKIIAWSRTDKSDIEKKFISEENLGRLDNIIR